MVAWMSERPRVGVAEGRSPPPPPSSSSASTSSSLLARLQQHLVAHRVSHELILGLALALLRAALALSQLVVRDLILERRVLLLLASFSLYETIAGVA